MIEGALLASLIAQARSRQVVARMLSEERAALADERQRTHDLAVAKARWLHEHGAEGSFPCGVTRPVLPTAEDGTTLRDRRTEVT